VRPYLSTAWYAPLQVAHAAAALLPLADVGPIERGGKGRELLGGEASRRSLGGFLCRGWRWSLHGAIDGADQLQG
jgi:hypothetical protein